MYGILNFSNFFNQKVQPIQWILSTLFYWDFLETWSFAKKDNSIQKQPSRGVLKKRFSKSMLQICRRTPMPKCDFNKIASQLYWNRTSACDFNKIASQLYWNRTSAWVFPCKFAEYFQNTFSYEHLWMAASEHIQFHKISPFAYVKNLSI